MVRVIAPQSSIPLEGMAKSICRIVKRIFE
jgi:hypothetical protein